MNVIELAEVFEKKYTMPLAHEAAKVLREQHDCIVMAKKCLEDDLYDQAWHHLNKASRIKL